MHKNRQTKHYDAYKAQRRWRGLSYVVSLFVSLFLPQLISPPNGEREDSSNKMSTGKTRMHLYAVWESWHYYYRSHNQCTPHLADIEGVMVEAFDKECNSSWWELVVISQQQWQEADCNVFKLPRPWNVKQSRCYRQYYINIKVIW